MSWCHLQAFLVPKVIGRIRSLKSFLSKHSNQLTDSIINEPTKIEPLLGGGFKDFLLFFALRK